ncbi:hypothetical protein O181_013609 [Austropuccinia psidii MF-1]|uniref:DNA-directed RNA polymerase III subunit n=1 Tax=Austropuccinia psidii MF-1 TaxID=1389203 RepID=A0A9Q3BWQ5_9BASI|nr:hypothetical protein [Austropuccinia psidii MF-1]
MSFGRGGGRGGRGGRGGGGGGGGGRGGIADLSLGPLSFADLLATSRADIGDVLYPDADIPATEFPSYQEARIVESSVDRWLRPSYPSSRRRWVVEGELKSTFGSKQKTKQRSGLAKPFLHRFSRLDIQEGKPSEDWLYSDRYKSQHLGVNPANSQPTSTSADGLQKSKYRDLLEKSFFPPDLWASFMEGKKAKAIGTKRAKTSKTSGKLALPGPGDDTELGDDGEGEKEDEEGDEEVAEFGEEEIDEDDPDYDNNYFDNGEGDEGMGSGGEGGDEGGVF